MSEAEPTERTASDSALPPSIDPPSVDPPSIDPAEFYKTGGTMSGDAASYVPRHADRELLAALSAGEFCYVLTSRQMGKSSLMVRTAAKLREAGAAVVLLDVTAFGQNLTSEQWYDSLGDRIGRLLHLEDEFEEYADRSSKVAPLQRWLGAITDVALRHLPGKLVIFLDEIDFAKSLPFNTDELFSAIRACYNQRVVDSEMERLTFCLLGVASPSDLIRDSRTTPFNIGQRIELTDFTRAEAAPLTRGLQCDPPTAARVLNRVMYWTSGHPYLTQRLCRAAAEAQAANDAGVDRLCEELFLSTRARSSDDNLLFTRKQMMRGDVDLAGLLTLYSRVRDRKRVPDDPANPLIPALRLSGVVRSVGGRLIVSNRIYERVFDRRWIESNMPDQERRRVHAAYRRGLFKATVVFLCFVALLVILLSWEQKNSRVWSEYETGERRWVSDLQHNLCDDNPECVAWRARLARSRDTDLDQLVGKWRARSNDRLKGLLPAPEELAQTTRAPFPTLSRSVIARAGEAIRVARELQADIRRWQLLAEVSDLAAKYDERGWRSQAAYLHGLVTDVTQPFERDPAGKLSDAIDNLARIERPEAKVTRDQLREIERHWSELSEDARTNRINGFLGAVTLSAAQCPDFDALGGFMGNMASRSRSIAAMVSEKDAAHLELILAKLPDWEHADVLKLEQFAEKWQNDFRAAGAVTDEAAHADPRKEWNADEELAKQAGLLASLQSSYGLYLAMVPAGNKAVGNTIAVETESFHNAQARWAALKRRNYETEPARIASDLAALKADVDASATSMTTARTILNGIIVRYQEKNASEWQDALDMARLRTVGKSQEVVRKAWDAECARLAASKAGNVAELRSHLKDAGDALDQLAGTAPLPPDVAPMRDWNRSAVAALQAAAQSQWEKSVTDALKAALSGGGFDPAPLKQATLALDATKGRLAPAKELIAGFTEMAARLDSLYTYDEKLAGKSIADLELDASRNPLASDPSLKPFLFPITEKVWALHQIETADRARLVQIVLSRPGPAQVRAAWLRLQSQGWPASIDEANDEANVREFLADAYKNAAPGARMGQLQGELAESGPAALKRLIDALPDLNVTRINDAMALAGKFAVKDREAFIQTLSARVRLGIRVREAYDRQAAEMPIIDQVALFRDAVEKIDPAGQSYASLLKRLVAVASSMKVFGPAAAPLNWKLDAPKADELDFIAPAGSYLCRFHKLQGADVYLCTSEMSVGLFIEVLDEAKNADQPAWDTLSRLLNIEANQSAREANDQREGARVWARTAQGPRIKVAPSWFRPREHQEVPDFDWPAGTPPRKYDAMPPGMPGGDPKPTHPMQKVTAYAAIYLAGLMHCRLPTTSEFAIACKMESDRGQPAWDLRDASYKKHFDYIARMDPAKLNGALQWPDAGIFWPKGVDPTAVQAEKGSAFFPTDDGVPFFCEVDGDGKGGAAPGAIFHHLIGNVAEWVFDGPSDAYMPGRTAKEIIDNVKANNRDKDRRLFIAGGSALSSPAVIAKKDLAAPQPVDLDDDADQVGYSDVGFRLALDYRPLQFADGKREFVAILNDAESLVAAKPAGR